MTLITQIVADPIGENQLNQRHLRATLLYELSWQPHPST
jgi:hypothetical protein